MNTKLVLERLSGAAVVVVLTGCGASEVEEAVDIDAPPSARAGNIASAILSPVGDSGVTGTVTFAQLPESLRIEASIEGLDSGDYGLDLHEYGDCSGRDAASAGGRFMLEQDPDGRQTDATSAHDAGDLGEMSADSTGAAAVTMENPELSLAGEYGVVGRAVIVRRNSDGIDSQPTGETGTRVACGVIGWGTQLSEALIER